MTALRGILPLLLVMLLPQVDTNVTLTGRQGIRLSCHVCERENSFECTASTQCDQNARHCVTAAVKILPRFYYVSKQCEALCPAIEYPPEPKNFRLEGPMPFLYVKCCNTNLCNGPIGVPKGVKAAFEVVRTKGGSSRISSGGFEVLLTLTSVLLSSTFSSGVLS